jgi:hypothetical protein
LPEPEGGRFDPVLTRRRAEAAAGVPRNVEEDPPAAWSFAGAEPIAVAGPEHAGYRFGADGRPHRDQGDVLGVVVKPPASLFLREVWVRRVLREQVVQSGRRCIEIARPEVVEHLTQRASEGQESCHICLAEAGGRSRVHRQDPCEGGQHTVPRLRQAGGTAGAELVSQLYRHENPRVRITI